jgi:serine protease Do
MVYPTELYTSDRTVLMSSNINVMKMFRAGVLAVGLMSLPLTAAQSQAPKARSMVIFSQSPSYLGIGVVDVTDERAKVLGLKEPQGVEVTRVTEDAPAFKAGIKRGDVILEFNGQHVEGGEQFVRMVQETPPGHKAAMQVWRNGTSQWISATIGSKQEFPFVVPSVPFPPFPPTPPMIPDTPHDMLSWHNTALGIETEALNSQLAEFFGVKEGILVRSVTKGSAGDAAGLKAGDVITRIDGQVVASPRNIAPFLRKSGNVILTVVRNHKELTLNVKVAKNLLRFDDCFPGSQPESPEIL